MENGKLREKNKEKATRIDARGRRTHYGLCKFHLYVSRLFLQAAHSRATNLDDVPVDKSLLSFKTKRICASQRFNDFYNKFKQQNHIFFSISKEPVTVSLIKVDSIWFLILNSWILIYDWSIFYQNRHSIVFRFSLWLWFDEGGILNAQLGGLLHTSEQSVRRVCRESF